MKRALASVDGTASQKPAVQSLFQRLERMEAEMESGHVGHNRWMIPYADLLTLLLGLFLVIFTTGRTEHAPHPEKSKPAIAAAAPKTQNIDSAQATQNIDTGAPLPQRLQARLQMKGVSVRNQQRGLVISLKDSILFAPGSADLSPQARQTLSRIAGELRASFGPELRAIRVEGHTDDTPIQTPQFPSNWELSTARATSIVRYLLESRQFPPEKLSAVGYAQFRPVDDNSTIEGKQKNRRVDIVVLRPDVAREEPSGTAHPAERGH
jgi:chemotaxis protein MotB